ncbi:MAG: cytochrome D ubiquinol oxidase subunit II, partial [Planctomycetota bacterium]
TGKCPPMPMILCDHNETGYWDAWETYVKDHLLANRLISESDLHLFSVTSDVDEAVRETKHFYSNFHSLRYTRELIVLRLHRKPSDRQLDAIREAFADICVDNDRWRVCGALKIERNEAKLRHLHRLTFPFNRRDHGRLRQLIDHLNDLPAE